MNQSIIITACGIGINKELNFFKLSPKENNELSISPESNGDLMVANALKRKSRSKIDI